MITGILLGLGFPILAPIFGLPWKAIPLGFLAYYAAALTSHLALPPTHPICLWFGGSWQSWLVAGEVGVVMVVYAWVVWRLWIRARVVPNDE